MAKKSTDSHAMATGAGLAAIAAAAAGAFFLYGTKEGAKQRKKIRGWGLRMKGEVLEKMEQMKEVSEDKYQEIVDSVAKRYQGLKSVDPEEVTLLVKELKSHWRSIKRQLDAGGTKKKAAPKKRSAPKKKSS